jgi:hypothetical protein
MHLTFAQFPSGKSMNRLIMICAIVLAAAPVPAFAQAGSTGGTIGKQDKSASGGEVRVPTRAHRAPLARKHHVAVREQRAPRARKHHVSEAAPARASCRNVTGTWSWTAGWFGKNDTAFRNDGTAYHIAGIPGTWTCLGDGVIFVDWTNWNHYKLKLSPDGKKLLDPNSGGASFVR